MVMTSIVSTEERLPCPPLPRWVVLDEDTMCSRLTDIQVLDAMTSVMAPALPYLAEGIHSTLREGDAPLSVFAKK